MYTSSQISHLVKQSTFILLRKQIKQQFQVLIDLFYETTIIYFRHSLFCTLMCAFLYSWQEWPYLHIYRYIYLAPQYPSHYHYKYITCLAFLQRTHDSPVPYIHACFPLVRTGDILHAWYAKEKVMSSKVALLGPTPGLGTEHRKVLSVFTPLH